MLVVRQHPDFPQALYASLLLIAIVALVLFLWTFSSSVTEEATYRNLMHEGGFQSGSSPQNGQQSRQSVQKDFFFPRDGERLQFRLMSESGNLYFVQEEEKNALREEMDQVRGIFQEQFFMKNGEVFQQIENFQAAHATYNYGNQTFLANDVLITQFQIPGTRLMVDFGSYPPVVQGNASQMDIDFSGGHPQLTLRHFKAMRGVKP